MTRRVRIVAALALAGVATACARESGVVHHRLEIADLVFRPEEAVVAPGDTVTWINRDLVPHTVTAADDSWDSGALTRDSTFSWVAQPGDSVRYVCRYHPMMTGVLVVGAR